MKILPYAMLVRDITVLALLGLGLAACSPSVKVRSDTDPGVDMRQYQTFDFFTQMAIEGENYSSLFGQHFRDAIGTEMTARGYSKSDSPQLQINVTIAADEKVRVNTYQDPYLHGGYYGYGYHHGFYGNPWYPYGGGTRTTVHQYTEANVYVDMVDAAQHKMVWQGVATFTVTEKMQKNLRESIHNTVVKIFSQYPVAAPGQ